MADLAHEETDRIIAELEKRIRREYKQAVSEVQDKLSDYLRRFEIKDEKWQLQVANGKKTAEEYRAWREAQIMAGNRWEALKDSLANDLHNANAIARDIIQGKYADVYAVNFNYATYLIEKGGSVDTAFTLYNRDAVYRILKDNPDLLPPPGDGLAKDILWQKQQLQSVTLQAIVQGESIPNIAKRIANTIGETNHAATIRYARTAITGSQNAGRLNAFERAEKLGVKMKKEWIATLDNRTRHEHRLLDGQQKDVDEPFEVEGRKIRFPGDIEADADLIWNCRCTMVSVVSGWEDKSGKLRDLSEIGDYDEWEEGHSKPEKITKQEEIAKAMKQTYIGELYGD